jgi:hypothetical protein
MKHSAFLSALLLISTLFVSCKKDTLNHENEFEKSYHEWQAFKQSSGDSYRYMVTFGSWTGFGTETIITVTNGKVTQRSYQLLLPRQGNPSPVPIPPDQMAWTENENEINTHTEMAAKAMTLDEVYEKARTEWLIKREGADVYFETKNNGMISSCGYVNNGCMDDCFNGIRIAYIQPL